MLILSEKQKKTSTDVLQIRQEKFSSSHYLNNDNSNNRPINNQSDEAVQETDIHRWPLLKKLAGYENYGIPWLPRIPLFSEGV